jgi:hypothetical protein
MISYRSANRSPRVISNVGDLTVRDDSSFFSGRAQLAQKRLSEGFSVRHSGQRTGVALRSREDPADGAAVSFVRFLAGVLASSDYVLIFQGRAESQDSGTGPFQPRTR